MYDSTKYDTKRLDPIKMITYNLWLSRGKPINDNQNPILNDASNEPQPEFPLPPSYTSAVASHLGRISLPASSTNKTFTPDPPTTSTTPISIEIQPGCSFWKTPQPDPIITSDVDASINDLENYSTVELFTELQNRAPQGMRYNIILEKIVKLLWRRCCSHMVAVPPQRLNGDA